MWTLGAWSTDNNVFHFQARQRDIKPVKPTGVSWRTMPDGSTEYYLDGELHSPNSSTPSQIITCNVTMVKLMLFHANGVMMRRVRVKLSVENSVSYTEDDDYFIDIGSGHVSLGTNYCSVMWSDRGRYVGVRRNNRGIIEYRKNQNNEWAVVYYREYDGLSVTDTGREKLIYVDGYRGRLDPGGFEFVEENRYHHRLPEQTSADINFAVCEPPAEPECCAICLDALDASAPLFKTSCNHIYHQSCLRESRTTKCPLCRRRYTEQPNTLEILKASALRQLREFDWSPREADLPFLTMGRPTLEAFLRGEYRPLFA